MTATPTCSVALTFPCIMGNLNVTPESDLRWRPIPRRRGGRGRVRRLGSTITGGRLRLRSEACQVLGCHRRFLRPSGAGQALRFTPEREGHLAPTARELAPYTGDRHAPSISAPPAPFRDSWLERLWITVRMPLSTSLPRALDERAVLPNNAADRIASSEIEAHRPVSLKSLPPRTSRDRSRAGRPRCARSAAPHARRGSPSRPAGHPLSCVEAPR